MREFSLTEFAGLLTEMTVGLHVANHEALKHAGEIVEKEAKRVLGTYDYGWAPLAQSTIDRKANGDTPLLETGEMRDSIGHHVDGARAVEIGSNNDKAVWHELGTEHIPARPFLMGALEHKGEEAAHVIGRMVYGYLAHGGKIIEHYSGD